MRGHPPAAAEHAEGKPVPTAGATARWHLTAPFEQGEIGPDLFRKACEFGREGIVSKHRERAYRPGTSPNWVKVKNPKHPAFSRVLDQFG
jgi:hypothetical protein